MRRRTATSSEIAFPLANLNGQVPTSGAAEEKWPNVMACLKPVFKEDKCVRQPGRLKITVRGRYYVCTLSCPTEGLEASLVLDTIDGVLDALEISLRGGTAIWLPDYDSQKKARRP